MYPEIIFPNLGIEIEHLSNVAFTIFGISIYWYGICIAMAFLVGIAIINYNAKRFDVNPDIYFDYLIWGILAAIIGARLYYCIFSWDYYKDNLLEIFNLRNGGLAIYGGIIGAFIAAYIYTKKKNLNLLGLADLAIPALAIGQGIGRWGNFFNKEAFGGYTDGLFAMAIRTDVVKYIPDSLADTVFKFNEGDPYSYLQVQPTFFYEFVCDVLIGIFLLFYCKKRKFDGQIVALYFLLYGIGRFFIESLRTDQLTISSTGIPVSMVISLVFVCVSLYFLIKNRKTENIGDIQK